MALTLWPTSWARDLQKVVFVGGFFMVQMLSIGPAYQSKALGSPQQAVDRSVGQLPGSRGIDVLPGGDAVEGIEHPAMRDHHDLLAGMAGSQRLDRARDPLAQLQQRFTALGRLPFGDALAPVVRMVRPGLVDFIEGLAFEHAETALAQSFFRHHRDSRRLGNGLRRFMGPAQVAGINRADLFGGQGFAHPLGLPASGVVQADIELALDASVNVPCGFTVANGNDAASFHRLAL